MKIELVTTLKRKATEIISALNQDHVPVLITQHGLPAAYLVDIETYEMLQRRVTILEEIACGEKAIERGETVTHAEAEKFLSKWLK